MSEFKQIKIVCFGGGTGLPSLLSGLKRNPWLDITAIVNMFDSGGSSGELRDRFGILPPGDILKCLLSLSEDEAVARKILLKRINHEVQPGHTGGNLLLLALERVYENYPMAIDALSQILSVHGKVLPVTLEQAALCAEHEDHSVSRGEVHVDAAMSTGKRIERLFLDPAVSASDQAIRAIRHADVLCIGPGSFYTSVLPNFLPLGVREALSATYVPAIFVCNLLTEGRGMDGVKLQDSIAQVEHMIGKRLATIIVNTHIPSAQTLAAYAKEQKQPILPTGESLQDERIIGADLWTDEHIARHDSERLAGLVFAVAERLCISVQ